MQETTGMQGEVPDFIGGFPLGLVRNAHAHVRLHLACTPEHLQEVLGLSNTVLAHRMLGVLSMRDVVEHALWDDDRRAMQTLHRLIARGPATSDAKEQVL